MLTHLLENFVFFMKFVGLICLVFKLFDFCCQIGVFLLVFIIVLLELFYHLFMGLICLRIQRLTETVHSLRLQLFILKAEFLDVGFEFFYAFFFQLKTFFKFGIMNKFFLISEYHLLQFLIVIFF